MSPSVTGWGTLKPAVWDSRMSAAHYRYRNQAQRDLTTLHMKRSGGGAVDGSFFNLGIRPPSWKTSGEMKNYYNILNFICLFKTY